MIKYKKKTQFALCMTFAESPPPLHLIPLLDIALDIKPKNECVISTK